MVQRKHICVEDGQKALVHIDHIPGEVVSARRFIIDNFDTIIKSGKSLKAIHQYLQQQCGIDVGTFSYFRDVFNRERRSRRLASFTSSGVSHDPPPDVEVVSPPPTAPDLKAERAVISVKEQQTHGNKAPAGYGAKTKAMNSSKSGVQVNSDNTFPLKPADPDDLPSLD